MSKLNTNLLQYLENNNININYYYFFSNVFSKKHYIITSRTTKNKLNGYWLITIQNTDKDNNISERAGSLNIIFEKLQQV